MDNFKIRISLQHIIAFGVVFFAICQNFIYTFLPSQALRLLFISCYIFIALIAVSRDGYIYLRELIWGICLMGITIPNNYFLNKYGLSLSITLSYLMFIFMIILMRFALKNIEWINISIKGLTFFYIFYALTTIIFKFTPDFYKRYIVNFFPENKARLLYWYKTGCMAGFTNHYSRNAMYLSVGLMIMMAKIIFDKKNRRMRDYVLTVIFCIAVLFTGKRAHVLFCIAAGLVMYYVESGKYMGTRIAKIIIVMIVGGGLGFLTLRNSQALNVAFSRLSASFNSEDITNNRIIWWEVAIKYYKQNKLLGIGWGQFYFLCGRETGYYAYAHNVFLQLLCEVGLVGFLIYVFWMLKSFIGTYKIVKAYRLSNRTLFSSDKAYLLGFSFGYQVFFLLYCMTGNPLYDRETFIPYFLACGIYIYFKELLKKNERLLKESKQNTNASTGSN